MIQEAAAKQGNSAPCKTGDWVIALKRVLLFNRVSGEACHEEGALGAGNHLACCDPLLLATADAPNHLTTHLEANFNH